MSDLTPRAGDWAARFSIQQMKPDHYAGKGYVHYQAWRESYRGLMGDQVLDGQTLEHCREMAAAYPENTLVLLDQNRSDQVAGFACYAPEARSFVSLPEASEIVALYLLHAYKGLGLGCRLMEASPASPTPRCRFLCCGTISPPSVFTATWDSASPATTLPSPSVEKH